MLALGSFVELRDDGTTCNLGVKIPHIAVGEVGQIVRLVPFNKADVRFADGSVRATDISWLKEADNG